MNFKFKLIIVILALLLLSSLVASYDFPRAPLPSLQKIVDAGDFAIQNVDRSSVSLKSQQFENDALDFKNLISGKDSKDGLDLIVVDSANPFEVLQASSLAIRSDFNDKTDSLNLRINPFFIVHENDFFALKSFLSTYNSGKSLNVLILGNSSFYDSAVKVIDSSRTPFSNPIINEFHGEDYFEGFSVHNSVNYYPGKFSLVISDPSVPSGIQASFIASALGYKLLFSNDPELPKYFNSNLEGVIFVDKNNNLTLVDNNKKLLWLNSVSYDSRHHMLSYKKTTGSDTLVPLIADYNLLTSNHFLKFQETFYNFIQEKSSSLKLNSVYSEFGILKDEISFDSVVNMPSKQKLVVYNPLDVYSCFSVPSFEGWFEKNQDFINLSVSKFNPSLFCKNSLLAPYLSLSRTAFLLDYTSKPSYDFPHQSNSLASGDLLPDYLDFKFSNFYSFDTTTFNSNLKSSNVLDDSGSSVISNVYLTFLGSPNSLPFIADTKSSFPFDIYLFSDLISSSNPSLVKYNMGHLFGLTVSDTSGLIARSLFEPSKASQKYHNYELKGPITFASANNPDTMFSDLAFLQSFPYYFKNNVTSVQFLPSSCHSELVTSDPLVVLPDDAPDPIKLDTPHTLVDNLDVEFTFDRASIRSGSPEIDAFAKKVLDFFDSPHLDISNVELNVSANTDARGTMSYNEDLSICRAMTVVLQLEKTLSSNEVFNSFFVKDFNSQRNFCNPKFDSTIKSSDSKTNLNGIGNGERVPRRIPLSQAVSAVSKFVSASFPNDPATRSKYLVDVQNTFNVSHLKSTYGEFIVPNSETGEDELELTTEFIDKFRCDKSLITGWSSSSKSSSSDGSLDPSLPKYDERSCPIYEALHTLNRRVELRFSATYTVPSEKNFTSIPRKPTTNKTFIPLSFKRGCFNSEDFEFLHHHYYYYTGYSKDNVAPGLNIQSRSFLPEDVEYPTTYFLDYNDSFDWNPSSDTPPLALVLARFGAKNVFFSTNKDKITSKERYFVDLLTKPYDDGFLLGGDVPLLMQTGNYLRSVPSSSERNCVSSSCSSDFTFFSRNENSRSSPWLLLGDSLSTVVSSDQYKKEPRFIDNKKVSKEDLGDGYGPKILFSYVDPDDFAFSSSFKRFSSDEESPLNGIMTRFDDEEHFDFDFSSRSIPVRAGKKVTVYSIVSVPESITSLRIAPELDYFSLDQPCQIAPELRDLDSKKTSREVSLKTKVKLPSVSYITTQSHLTKVIPCPDFDSKPSFFRNSGSTSKTVVHGKKYSLGLSIPLPSKTTEAKGSALCTKLTNLNFPRNIADKRLEDFDKTKRKDEKLMLCSVDVDIPKSTGTNNLMLVSSKWYDNKTGIVKPAFKEFASLYSNLIGDSRDYLLFLRVYSGANDDNEKDILGRLDTLHLFAVKDKLSLKVSSENSEVVNDKNSDVESSFKDVITLRTNHDSFILNDGSLSFNVDIDKLIPPQKNDLFKLSPIDSQGQSLVDDDYLSKISTFPESNFDVFSARCDKYPSTVPPNLIPESVFVNIFVQSKLLSNGGFWLNVSKDVLSDHHITLSIPNFAETFKSNLDPDMVKKYKVTDYSVFSELFALSFYPSIMVMDKDKYLENSAESASVQTAAAGALLNSLTNSSSSEDIFFVLSPSCMNMFSDKGYRDLTFGFAQSSISPLPLCYTGQYSKPGNSVTFVNPLIDVYSDAKDLKESLGVVGFPRFSSLNTTTANS